MKGARLSFCIAEMQPVLSKDSEYLGQYKNRQFGFYIYYDKKTDDQELFFSRPFI